MGVGPHGVRGGGAPRTSKECRQKPLCKPVCGIGLTATPNPANPRTANPRPCVRLCRVSAITTHVLDISRGVPAAGVEVTLEWSSPREGWQLMGKGATDPDGRLRTLMPEAGSAPPGLYRLQFATGAYFQERGTAAFHPHITVTFEVLDGEAHHHVPLLVSPFGYTTYRGS